MCYVLGALRQAGPDARIEAQRKTDVGFRAAEDQKQFGMPQP